MNIIYKLIIKYYLFDLFSGSFMLKYLDISNIDNIDELFLQNIF